MKQRTDKGKEIELITEIYNGDQKAFGRMFSEYRDGTINGIHIRYPKVPKDVVCDIYTDVCVKLKDNILVKYLRVEDGRIVNKKGNAVSLKGYLFTMMRNKVQDYCDANNIIYQKNTIEGESVKSKKPLIISIDSLKRVFINTYDDYDDYLSFSDDDIAEDNRLGIIRKAIRELTEVCRNILIAYYCDELSMKTIAEKLGYNNADTAKQQKSRCFNKFRAYVLTLLKKD